MARGMLEPNCGGCKGLGAHSRRCRTQPGWFWHRLQDMAEELADLIGSNDVECANAAYHIATCMRARALSASPESAQHPVQDRNHPAQSLDSPGRPG